MRLWRQSNGQTMVLDSRQRMGRGGEGDVYALPAEPTLAVKIYHKPTPERTRKLAVMLACPPDDPMARQGQPAIAWPCDLLRDSSNQTVGFLMPRVSGVRPIIDFFNPQSRLKHCPLFNYPYLLHTARNLAVAMRAIHTRGYVVGDIN